MKTLANPRDAPEILARLRRVSPDSRRRWGRMTSHQMLCHLADALRHTLGERPVSAFRPTRWRTKGLKWLALWMPVQWPHGFRTRPELDALRGGTPPADFTRDLAVVEELTKRLILEAPRIPGKHPLFGALTEKEWLRFCWLHLDHHLRQFGV